MQAYALIANAVLLAVLSADLVLARGPGGIHGETGASVEYPNLG